MQIQYSGGLCKSQNNFECPSELFLFNIRQKIIEKYTLAPKDSFN